MAFLRKYGVATTIPFPLIKANNDDLEPAATFAAGDVKIMKDEGVEANTTNLPTDEGQGYSIAPTATEMQAARIVLYIVDQSATKVWKDQVIIIETYGHASAQHSFDLDTAQQSVTVASMNANVLTASAIAANALTAAKIAADAIGSSQLSAAAVDKIIDEVIEGSLTFRQIVRIVLAAAAGKASGLATTTANYRDVADTKNRISATVDADGNRSAVTLDGT